MTADTTAPPPAITVREVLRLLLEADSYPRLGNQDWREADIMEAEALAKAATAIASPGDPPEFARWLATLRDPLPSDDERAEIMSAIYDLFESA
jgi:hypothetical protein